MSKTAKYLRYVKAWEDNPNLKEWIAPMIGDVKAAYCKVCRRPLHPHKKDLLLHSKAKKHLRNLERYKEFYKSSQPLKEAQLGDGSYEFSPENIKIESKYSFEHADHTTLKPLPREKVTIAVFSESQDAIREHDVKTLGDEIDDTASIIISDDPVVNSSNPEHSQWKNIPEFKGWLEVDAEKASCRVCDRKMRRNKTEILKHSVGKLHQKKCLKYGIQTSQTDDEVGLSLFYNKESLRNRLKVIDLRSDTITQPNTDMKSAMLNSDIGDDSFGDDQTVKELEEKVAKLLDKECGLLVPSGTMANLIAAMTHCWSRDSEVILGEESHLYRWSQGALARMGGIQTKPIKNDPDGSFSLARLKALLEESKNSQWLGQTLICIENPHNRMGGRVLPLEWMDELGHLCQDRGLLLHMDGARLLNASISCGSSPATLLRHCNTSTFCLNKGLGAPMGSILVGSKDFIKRAKRLRTMLGGTMHQAGIFAAAALYAFDNIAPKLHWDHANARAIAQSVRDMHSSAVLTDLKSIQTNFVHLQTDNIRVNAKTFCDRLETIKASEFQEIGEDVKVLMLPVNDTIVRFVTHYDLSKCDIHLVIRKLKFVIEEYDNMLKLNFGKQES